ncbi:putative cyclase [Fomitopsis serialis]|uniref:putative cyclase n=1 Tax=Fomitopsis serialis TaxID=139415 RepID=UPI0020081823|nr:putative cyclase [Neoantrodia serialis]KAH9927837.1 putative cyclase [Neoantrodia serialis]
MAAEFIDLSQTLDLNTQAYPGDPIFSCCPNLTIEHDGANIASISMSSHTGTHVDAPYHFVPGGKRLDDVPLSRFVGRAVVVDVSNKAAKEPIVWSDLQPYEERLRRCVSEDVSFIMLVRTDWSRYWGTDEYFEHPYLDREAAERVIATGVRTIGIGTLSPDATHLDPHAEADFAVHQVILGAGGIIAENLSNLGAIQDGDWIVNMVPLKIGGCDGSPVRAFAWRRTSGTR